MPLPICEYSARQYCAVPVPRFPSGFWQVRSQEKAFLRPTFLFSKFDSSYSKHTQWIFLHFFPLNGKDVPELWPLGINHQISWECYDCWCKKSMVFLLYGWWHHIAEVATNWKRVVEVFLYSGRMQGFHPPLRQIMCKKYFTLLLLSVVLMGCVYRSERRPKCWLLQKNSFWWKKSWQTNQCTITHCVLMLHSLVFWMKRRQPYSRLKANFLIISGVQKYIR